MKTRWILFFILALALGIRFYDLTDPPFDFHSTRQFRSAVIARGMYYARLDATLEPQRTTAIQQWREEQQLEPPILEWLTAVAYHLPGGEALWKARILSATFWVLGGWALYGLVKELTSPAAAVISSLVYLFLPYGVLASRSFQPDPMMIGLMVLAVWRFVRWHQTRTWRDAMVAGSLAGFAILCKAVAIFPIGSVAVGLLFFSRNWKQSLREGQTWVFGLLALGPGAIYYVYGLWIAGFLQGQAEQSFLPHLWLNPNYYLRWAGLGVDAAGFWLILVGLVGILLWQSRIGRILSIGWWVGYALYGLAFPYHIMTHDYYQLPLIPIVALSLAPVVEWVRQKPQNRSPSIRIALMLVVVGWVGLQIWTARTELAQKSYQSDAEEWSRFQALIPPHQNVLALVQAYGYPLKYYGWTDATLWANKGDIALRELTGQSAEELEQRRWAQFEGMDLFLITNFNEYERQPELQEYLTTNFEIYDEGEGYIIFDLHPE